MVTKSWVKMQKVNLISWGDEVGIDELDGEHAFIAKWPLLQSLQAHKKIRKVATSALHIYYD